MKEYFLKDLITIKNGKDYKHLKDGDIPVYGTGGVMTYVDEYICDNESVLLPRKGSLDNIMYASGKFWTVDTMYWTEVNWEKVYPRYLYYYLSLLDLSSRDSGSTLPSMTFDSYYQLHVNIPSLGEQRKILDILEPIDKKIEINNQINDNLLNYAQLLFDYWFVQFKYPGNHSEPSLKTASIDIDIIPQDWSIETIEHFCRIFTGKKDVNQASDEGPYKFYSCAPEYKYSDEYLYSGKAILISGNGSYTGRTIYVDDTFDLYQRTYACVPLDDTCPLGYIFFWINRFMKPKVSGGTHGSAIPYIVFNDIAKEKIMFNSEIVNTFNSIVTPILQQIITREKESQYLIKQRNFILPLLMNGQATIAD